VRAQPGHYAGTTSQNEQITFDVVSGGLQLANLYVSQVNENCTPAAYLYGGTLQVASWPISVDGSFTISWSGAGTVGPSASNFQATIQGRFNGSIAAGTLRTSTSYTDSGGTYHTCGSDLVSWTAALVG
jgi:hypothetical protein